MGKEDKQTWKTNYFVKVKELFTEYNKAFVVHADNVGSHQMQQIRSVLRSKGVVLMGKNTMIRKAIRGMLDDKPDLEKLLPVIKGNVGFVFTNEDLLDVRTIILSQKVPAAAKAGAISPLDVYVPPGNTGMGPEKTSFFQALAIPTKITKGAIEILNEVHLIKKGDKVGASESTLLQMLKVNPFFYGLEIRHVFSEGSIFEPAILDITDDDLRARFMEGVRNVAAISLAIGYPTMASAPHSIVNGFKNLVAIAIETDISFAEVEKIKEYLANPEAFAAAAPAATSAAPAAAEAAPAAKEESESEDDDMGFGLFD